MPRLDMTGPMGAGPRTGRGMGPCGGGLGRKRGWRSMRGRGWFGFNNQEVGKEEQLKTVTTYRESLEKELEEVKKEEEKLKAE